MASPLQVSGKGWPSASPICEGICTLGPVVPPGPCPARAGSTAPSKVLAVGHEAPCTPRCWLGLSFTPFAVGAARPSVAQPNLAPKGALWAQSDGDWDIVPWVPLALLWGQPPLQGVQVLPCCCAGFVTVRLMLVIGSFYHLNVSSQLLKPASARIYYLANKYKCRFIWLLVHQKGMKM